MCLDVSVLVMRNRIACNKFISFFSFFLHNFIGKTKDHGTVTNTDPLVNVIRQFILFEFDIPVMEWDDDTHKKIFTFLKSKIKDDDEINIRYACRSVGTIKILNFIDSFEHRLAWLYTDVIDCFSSLLNAITYMNEMEVLPFQDQSWFQEDLYFKSTGTLCGKSKKSFLQDLLVCYVIPY